MHLTNHGLFADMTLKGEKILLNSENKYYQTLNSKRLNTNFSEILFKSVILFFPTLNLVLLIIILIMKLSNNE